MHRKVIIIAESEVIVYIDTCERDRDVRTCNALAFIPKKKTSIAPRLHPNATLLSRKMASDMPIPAPPRTPSPLSEDELDAASHGTPIAELRSARQISFGPNASTPSPMSDTFASRYGNNFMNASSTLSPSSAERLEEGVESFQNPFNFQTVTYTAGKATPAKSVRSPYQHNRLKL